MPDPLRTTVPEQDPRSEPPHHMPEHIDPAPELTMRQGNIAIRPGVRGMGGRAIAMLVVLAVILGVIAFAGMFM